MPKGVSTTYSGAARSAAARKGAASRAAARQAQGLARLAMPRAEIDALIGTETDRTMGASALRDVVDRAIASAKRAKERAVAE